MGASGDWCTLCANLCCCRPTAIAPPCRALDNGLEYEDLDDRIEARVLELRALCIAVIEFKYLQMSVRDVRRGEKRLEKQHGPTKKPHRNIENSRCSPKVVWFPFASVRMFLRRD